MEGHRGIIAGPISGLLLYPIVGKKVTKEDRPRPWYRTPIAESWMKNGRRGTRRIDVRPVAQTSRSVEMRG
jgi:hypothetical protein